MMRKMEGIGEVMKIDIVLQVNHTTIKTRIQMKDKPKAFSKDLDLSNSKVLIKVIDLKNYNNCK